MDVLEIKTREELEAWFRDQPRSFAQVVAVRAALRVLPYVVEAKNVKNFASDILLPVFWAVTTSWVARQYPTHDVAASASATSRAFSASASASAASRAFSASASATVWKESLQDCAFLEGAIAQAEEAEHVARDLVGQPLWRTQSMPAETLKRWNELKDFLSNAGDNWKVWRYWYQARLDGGKTTDVPSDLLETFDVDIAALDEELWKQEPAEVNAEVWRLMDATLEEAAKRLPDGVPEQEPATIKPVWVNGQLTLPTEKLDDDFEEGSIESAFKALKSALAEFAGQLKESNQNIDPSHLKYLSDLAEKVPLEVPPQDELFDFARNGGILEALVETAQKEWSALSAAQLQSVADLFQDTVGKFPEWRGLKKKAVDDPVNEEQARSLSTVLSDFLKDLVSEGAKIFVHPVIVVAFEHLNNFLQERLDDPWRTAEIKASFIAADLLESFANVMKKLVGRLLPHIKAGANEALDKAAHNLGKLLVNSSLFGAGAVVGKAPLLSLIETFPKQLSFLKPYLELIPTFF